MKKLLAPVLLGVFLGGCAVGPDYKQPAVAVPEQYREVQGPPAPGESLADLQWWETFGDPVLKGLIDEALAHGYDVRIAASRVDEARARAGIAKSQFFPQIGYGGDVSRGLNSTEVVPGSTTRNLVSANVNFGWELDLWGRIRRLNESAKAQYLATEEARRGVVLSLVSEVANDLLHAPRARRAARHLEVDRRLVRGAVQALRPEAQGGSGLLHPDDLRQRGRRPGGVGGAGDRTADRGDGKPVGPAARPEPGAHPEGRGALGAGAAPEGPGGPPVGPPEAAAGHPPGRAGARRRERRSRSRDGELLPVHQPDGTLRRRQRRRRRICSGRARPGRSPRVSSGRSSRGAASGPNTRCPWPDGSRRRPSTSRPSRARSQRRRRSCTRGRRSTRPSSS